MQESLSENVLAALRNLASPRALVLRDGKRVLIAGREVVRGEQDADTAGLLSGDRGHDRLLRRRIDGREGLVEQEDRSPLGERTGQQHPLALSARQRPVGTVTAIDQADLVERAAGRTARRRVDTSKQPWRSRSLQHDVQGGNGEVGVGRAVLGHEGQVPGDVERARRGQQSEQREQQRRLAGPVRPHDRDQLAGSKVERDVGERSHTIAIDSQTFHLEQRCSGGQPLRPSTMRSTLPRIMPM